MFDRTNLRGSAGGTYCPCASSTTHRGLRRTLTETKTHSQLKYYSTNKPRNKLIYDSSETFERHSRSSSSQHFGTNYTEFLQKHLFLDLFGASGKN